MYRLAKIYDPKQQDKALVEYHKCLAIFDMINGDRTEILYSLVRMGAILQSQKRYELAEAKYK